MFQPPAEVADQQFAGIRTSHHAEGHSFLLDHFPRSSGSCRLAAYGESICSVVCIFLCNRNLPSEHSERAPPRSTLSFVALGSALHSSDIRLPLLCYEEPWRHELSRPCIWYDKQRLELVSVRNLYYSNGYLHD